MRAYRIVPAILSLLIAPSLFAQADASCAPGSEEIRIAALSGLAQSDPDQVLPAMKKILDRRGACDATIRRQVISYLSRSRYGDQSELLLSVARTDPSPDVRRAAVQALAQGNSERGTAALDSIVFANGDIEVRDAALRALAQSSYPSARASVRRAVEQASLPVDLRIHAVNALATPRRYGDEAAYLIALYPKVDQPDLRESIVRAIGFQRTPESSNWLLGIARDRARDIEVRRQALSALGQTLRSNESTGAAGVDLNAILGLYDSFAGQVEMQDRALDVIAQRQETAATDKLLQIARSETNVELRRKAIVRVGQRRDPRVRDFLLEVINAQ